MPRFMQQSGEANAEYPITITIPKTGPLFTSLKVVEDCINTTRIEFMVAM